MVTPRNRTYSTTANTTIYGGIASVPSWVGNPGTVSAIPNSTFAGDAEGWTGTSPGGSGNYRATMYAYSGGVYNETGFTTRGGIWIPRPSIQWCGGGHSDYAGNENYCLDYALDTPKIYRLTDPTSPTPGPNAGRDANGNPVSCHTYDTLIWDSTRNQTVRLATAGAWGVGNSYPTTNIFDNYTNTNTPGPDIPPLASSGALDGMSCVDPLGSKWWLITRSQLYSYDIATRVATAYSDNFSTYPSQSKACFDPNRRFAMAMDVNGVVRARDMNNISGSSWYTPTTTGTVPSGMINAWVMDWDTINNRAVAWHYSTPNTLWFLTPNTMSGTWVWSSTTYTGVTVANDKWSGVYGRGRCIKEFGGAFLLIVNHTVPAVLFRF